MRSTLVFMRRPRNAIAVVVISLLAIGGVFVAVGRGSAPDLPTVEVKRGEFTDLLEIRGEIRPLRSLVLASPMLSNEALYLLSKLVKKTGGAGAFRVPQGEEAPLPGVEDLALRRDRAANANGAELVGFSRSDNPLSGMKSGDVLIIADEELSGVSTVDVSAASAVIVIGTMLPKWAASKAAVVLPTATMAEEDGTFTNLRGRVQRFTQAKAPPGFARPSWWVIADVLTAIGDKTELFLARDVFAAMARDVSAFNGMTYDTLGLKGRDVSGAAAGAGARA